MPLELHEVLHPSEWNELIQCECESYETPFNSFYLLLRPNRGDPHRGIADQKSRDGFKELRDRQRKWHEGNPTSKWFKVIDTDLGGKVVGGGEWNTYEENPHTKGPQDHPLEGDWWPEGEEREFANSLLDQWLQHRSRKMARPHMLLAILFVHPEHRRRGVGSLIVSWGTREADRLGIESFVEATDDGKPCYEAHGFVYMNTFYLDSARRNPSRKWVEMGNYLRTPIHCYLMWRPKGGEFVEGETVVPWENRGPRNW